MALWRITSLTITAAHSSQTGNGKGRIKHRTKRATNGSEQSESERFATEGERFATEGVRFATGHKKRPKAYQIAKKMSVKSINLVEDVKSIEKKYRKLTA